MTTIGTTRKRAWFTAGGVVTALVLAYAGYLAITWLVPDQRDDSRQTYHQSVSKVELDFNEGSATVRAGPDGQVDVEQLAAWSVFGEPTIEHTWNGDTLRISVRCPSGWVPGSSNRCSVDLALRVPANVAVDARTEGGTLRVRDLTGDTRLSNTAGELVVENAGGKVWAHSDSGTVTGTGLRSPEFTVEMETGNTELQFVQAPRLVNAMTNAGDVQITVPRGAYQVQTQSESESAAVEVRSDPSASSKITAQANGGQVNVRYGN